MKKIDLKLPVYDGDGYQYVRIKDIEDEYIKEEFRQFMAGQTMPLFYSEEEKKTIQDAVFVYDYEKFLRVLNGEYTRGFV